jgi:hypothetical protein
MHVYRVLQNPCRRAKTARRQACQKKAKKRITANDIYQLIVGEIGISRHEFLYELRFWEVDRIIRGYRRRNILHYQLQRMNIWASMFCMGNPEKKKPEDIFHLYFDDELDNELDDTALTEEDRAGLQADIDAWNANLNKKTEK